MPRIQGIGSTRSTNRPQGGGNVKQGLPPSVGRPANLMRFIMINSYRPLPAPLAFPTVPTVTTPACITVTADAVDAFNADKTLKFQIAGNTGIQNILVGFAVTETGGDSLAGTVETITAVDGTYLIFKIAAGFTGTITDSTQGRYTFTNC